jgi:glyoxylate/hydroxypyruvate reductase A
LLADVTLPAHVPIARMVDPMMNRAMAETAAWAVLSLHRRAFDYAAQQRQTLWRPLPQKRADEVAVLVLGLGQMGRTAALQLAALGYRVSGWSARAQEVAGIATCAGWAALPTALRAADIVVNLLPLTDDTRGLFNQARLAQMRPGASLVNLARGAHVVEKDLLVALNSGHLAHAMLDVVETEPLPATHVFWFHPRVTLWPHVAALTDLRSAAALVAANIEAVRRGEPAAHLVDRSRGY